MSSFLLFQPDNLGEARCVYSPAPENQLEGQQTCRNWNVDKTADGALATGVWEIIPGAYRVTKQEEWEFGMILRGSRRSPKKEAKPSDAFVLEPGFVGTWKVIKTTREKSGSITEGHRRSSRRQNRCQPERRVRWRREAPFPGRNHLLSSAGRIEQRSPQHPSFDDAESFFSRRQARWTRVARTGFVTGA